MMDNKLNLSQFGAWCVLMIWFFVGVVIAIVLGGK